MEYRDLEHMQKRMQRIRTNIGNVENYLNQQLNERFSSLLKQGKISERELDYFGAKLIYDDQNQVQVKFDHLFDQNGLASNWSNTFVGQALNLTKDERVKFWPTLVDLVATQAQQSDTNDYVQNAHRLLNGLQDSIANQTKLLKHFIKHENPSLFFDQFINQPLGKAIVESAGFSLLSVLANGQNPQAHAATRTIVNHQENNLVGAQVPVFSLWTKQVVQHWLSAKNQLDGKNDNQTNFHHYFQPIFKKANDYYLNLSAKLAQHNQLHQQPFSQKELKKLATAQPEAAFLYHLKNRLIAQIDPITKAEKAILNSFDLDQWASLIMSNQKWFDAFCNATFCNSQYLEQLNQAKQLTIKNTFCDQEGIEILVEDPDDDGQVAIDHISQLQLKVNNFSLFEDPLHKKWSGWGIQSDQIKAVKLVEPQASNHFQNLDPSNRVIQIKVNRDAFKDQASYDQWLANHKFSVIKNPAAIEPYRLDDFFATQNEQKIGAIAPLVVALKNLDLNQPNASSYDFNQAFIKIQLDHNHHLINQINQTLAYVNNPYRYQDWTAAQTSIRHDYSQEHSFLPIATMLATIGKTHHESQQIYNDPHYENTVVKALEVHQLLATKIDFNDPDLNWFQQDQLIGDLEREFAQLELIAAANPNHQKLQNLLKTQTEWFKKYRNYQSLNQAYNLLDYDVDRVINEQLSAQLAKISDPDRKEKLKIAWSNLQNFQLIKANIPHQADRRYEVVKLIYQHHAHQLINQWQTLANYQGDEQEFTKLYQAHLDQIYNHDQLWNASKVIKHYCAPTDLWNDEIIAYEKNHQSDQDLETTVALAKATTDQNRIVQIADQPVSRNLQTGIIHANAILQTPNPQGSLRLAAQKQIAQSYLEQVNPTINIVRQIYNNDIDLDYNLSSVEAGIVINAIFDQISANFNDPDYLNAKQNYFHQPLETSDFNNDLETETNQNAYSFRFATDQPQWNQSNPSDRLGKNYASLYEQMVSFWRSHVSEDQVVKIAKQLVLDPKVKAQLNAYEQAQLTKQTYQLDPQLKLAIDQELVRQLFMDPYYPNAMQNIINLIQGGSDFNQWYKRDRAGRYVRINPTTIVVGNQPVEIHVKDPLPEHYSRSQHQEFAIRNQKTFARFDHFYQQLQQHQNVGLQQWKQINEKYNNRSLRTIAWASQSSALGLSLVGAALALRSNRNAQFAALLAGPLGIILLFLAPLTAAALTRGFAYAKAKGWQIYKNHKLKKIEKQYFLVNQLQKATINDLYPHSQNPHLEIDTLSASIKQVQSANQANFFPWQGENGHINYDIFQNLKTIKSAQDLKTFSHHQDLEKFNLSLKHQNIDMFAILNQSENIVSGFKSIRDLAYEDLNQKLLNLAMQQGPWIVYNEQNQLVPNQSLVGFKALPPSVFRDQVAMEKYQQFLSSNWDDYPERRSDLSFHEIFKTTICENGKCQDNIDSLIKEFKKFGFGPPDDDPKTIEQWKLLFSDQDQARALFYQNQPWDFHCATIVKDHQDQPVLDPTTTNILKSLTPEGLRQYIDKKLLFDHDLKPFIGARNNWDLSQQWQQFFDEKLYYQLAQDNYQALINTLKQIGTPQQLINQISQKHRIISHQATLNAQLTNHFDHSDQSQWAGLNTYLKTIPVDQTFINDYFANLTISDYESQLEALNEQIDRHQDQQMQQALTKQKADLLKNYDQNRAELQADFLKQFDPNQLAKTNDFKNDLLYNHENVVAIDQDFEYQSSVENHTIIDDSKMAFYVKMAWSAHDDAHPDLKPPALNQEQDLVLKYLDFISNHEPKIAMNASTWEHFLINELMYQDSLKHNRQNYRDSEWLNYQDQISDRKYEKQATKQQQSASKQLDLKNQTIYSQNEYGLKKWWKRHHHRRKWQDLPIAFAFDQNGNIKFKFNQMQTMLVGVFNHQKVRRYIQTKAHNPSVHQENYWSKLNRYDFIHQQSQTYQNEQIKKSQINRPSVSPIKNNHNSINNLEFKRG